jgi:site-specific DNA recombinase
MAVALDIPKEVGIWVRVSTEDQVRGESPEHHERRARAYAEAKGWRVVEVYRLDAVSGKAVMGHAESKRMLSDVRAGKINGLVFSKLARLARNTKELLEFSEIFRKEGADLISLQESIDTSSPAGRLFFTMIAAMAQWEREEIGERVAASVPIRARLGKSLGGQPPYGYRWREGTLEPDPQEAPIRMLLHELFLVHRRKKTVARLLNDQGHRTRSGSRFTNTTVDRLLQDPTAKGVRRANYTTASDRTGAWELKPEVDWILTRVEPIISEELWDECFRIVKQQREEKAPARKVVHLFSGVALCVCGAKMYVWANSPKYVCVKCRNKIPLDDLEAVFREQLTHFLIAPEEIAAHNAAADEALREKEKLAAAVEADLRRIEVEDERLYQLYLADGLSKDDFRRRHQPLSERRLQLEEELPRVQAQCDLIRIGKLSREEALGEARDLAERWPELSFEDRRQIVETITDRIIVGKEDVEITLLNVSTPYGIDAEKGALAPPFMCLRSARKAQRVVPSSSTRK